MWLAVLYFGLGVVADILITRHAKAIYLGRRYAATALSFVITVLSMKVIEKIVSANTDVLILAFAAGCAAGTFIGMGRK